MFRNRLPNYRSFYRSNNYQSPIQDILEDTALNKVEGRSMSSKLCYVCSPVTSPFPPPDKPNKLVKVMAAAFASSVITHPFLQYARQLGSGSRSLMTPKSFVLEGVYGVLELGSIEKLKDISDPTASLFATWVSTTAIGTVVDPLLAYGVSSQNFKKVAFNAPKIVQGIALRQGLFSIFAKADTLTSSPVQKTSLELAASVGMSYATYLGFKGHPDFRPRTIQQLVGFTVLAPSHTTWFDAFMLGVGIYVFMRIQRGIIYTDFALRLLRNSPFGPSILNFAKDLRQMAEAEIEKQKEEEEKRKQEEDKNIEKNILPANVDLSNKDGDDSNKKFS